MKFKEALLFEYKAGEFKPNATPRSIQQREYKASPKEKKKRVSRNRARREMERQGKCKKGDGKDVDHKNHNALDNGNGNLRVISQSKNRADNVR